jgi:large subunit ribosomal protein L7/L12
MSKMSPRELVEEIARMDSWELGDLASTIEDEFSASKSNPAADLPFDYTVGFWRYESGYKVVLVDCGSDKIELIKLLRWHFDLTLKGAIDQLKHLPMTIKEACSYEEAYDLKAEYEKAGAVVAFEDDFYRVYDPTHISPGYAYD